MKIRIDRHADYVEFIVTGEMDADAVVEHISSYFEEHSDRCVLWSLSGCDLSTLTPEQFPQVARAAGASLVRRQAGARTALHVHRRVDRMLLSAFVARSEATSELPMRAFQDSSKAIAWLKETRVSTDPA